MPKRVMIPPAKPKEHSKVQAKIMELYLGELGELLPVIRVTAFNEAEEAAKEEAKRKKERIRNGKQR